MYHYVYRITNKVTGIHYYGKRSSYAPPSTDIGVKYFSSSKDKKFIEEQKKYPQNFKYKVVRICNSSEEALILEVKLHNKFKVGINPKFYNKVEQTTKSFSTLGKVMAKDLSTGGILLVAEEEFLNNKNLVGIRSGSTMTDEHRAIISKSNKNKPLSEEHKRNISKANKGRPMSPKSKKAFEEQRAKPVTKETREKLSKAGKGRKFTEEHKHNLSISQKGKSKPCTKTKEQLLKMGERLAKKVDIYCYYTNKLIAENVIMARWAKENGYDAPQLSKTTKRDLNKPKSKTNVYQHKGIYAVKRNNNETRAYTKRKF